MSDVDEVYMNVPAVQNIATMFKTFSEVATAVCAVLDTLSETLKNTAFKGEIGDAAANFINNLRPKVNKLAEDCAEISRDVNDSVTAFENGDEKGKTRFY